MIERITIDADRLRDTFLTILRINSYYPNEDAVIRALQPKLDRAGVELTTDENRNVLGSWPGVGSLADQEPILLCAHTDTVQPTDGLVPVVRDGAVHSDGSTVLGADDKAAVAAIVEALEMIIDAGIPHPPAEILFTVGEDVGHIGSNAFDATRVRSKMAFVPDADGPVGGIMLQAPWSQTSRVTFHGRAAHAGMEPEKGRSAIAMAANAIAQMPHGRIDDETTANVGTISGGEASNVVPPHAEIVWNARSLDEQKCERICSIILQCCRQAAASADGTIDVEPIQFFAGFRFSAGDAIVKRAASAIKAAGIEPWYSATCGGSDASELNAKGLPTIVLSVGYQKIHTCQESMPLIELNRLARVCAALVLGT
jgi:tripeptide aminopeptidase